MALTGEVVLLIKLSEIPTTPTDAVFEMPGTTALFQLKLVPGIFASGVYATGKLLQALTLVLLVRLGNGFTVRLIT